MKNRLILVTGGARSGKSRYAQSMADEIEGRKVYLATAHALDDEMKSRIEIHRMDRPAGWNTVEETKHLSKAVREIDKKFEVILIDCITMWISNLLVIEGFSESEIMKELESFISNCKEFEGTVIVVCNEVGSGIVPDNKIARLFRDITGKANQETATAADNVYLVVAGIPMKLKG